MWHWLRRIPSHLINGASAAAGIGLVQLLAVVVASVAGAAGAAVGAAALAGAVYSSLADTPNPRYRTWRRVLAAGLVGTLTSVVVGALAASPLWLGVAVAVIGALSALALAWGPRAGPLSFVGILAFVFTMAAPPAAHWQALVERAGWTMLGAALYLFWAIVSGAMLQHRYRVLALAEAIESIARLLRSRAAVVRAARWSSDSALSAWIADDAIVDERLRVARDLLYDAPDSPASRQQIALLIAVIDLRDTFMTSGLDLELLGDDVAARRVRAALGEELEHHARALDAVERAVTTGEVLPALDDPPGALQALEQQPPFASGDARAHMLPLLLARARHLREDAARMRALMHDAAALPPRSREHLQWFVSPEGWPLAALRPHLRMRSPVLRHALRSGAALGAAYAIGISLPWASHPHWLVLSVAVVLRGTLEQTLSRRNARVAGTAAGCLLALALLQMHSPALSSLAFLAAAGLAHAFVMKRYFVTSVAGTVLALLQAHLVSAVAGGAVAERLADTVLGALLAWAFSYVLPAWERRGVSNIVERLLRALAALTAQALRLPDDAATDAPANRSLLLARREAYDALGAVAAVAQRTRAEPGRVRVPVAQVAALIAHGHALLGHLAAVKMALAQRGGELPRAAAEAALSAAAADVSRVLDGSGASGASGATAPTAPIDDDLALPAPSVASAVVWLGRRLHYLRGTARQLVCAAEALRTAVARPPRRERQRAAVP